jgi:hypothetical protein
MPSKRTWKRWPSLNCPAGASSNDSVSTSHAVSSTTRRAGLRVAHASRISSTRKLRTSRGGHADCSDLCVSDKRHEEGGADITCKSRSSPSSKASLSCSTRFRAKRASQPASFLLARRKTELASDAESQSSNIDSI